uniref:FHA domain-containing protein n=1 Tax=Romanomermis culicivorax TaxID=13658 RepID=A0A915JFM5_ROMCU
MNTLCNVTKKYKQQIKSLNKYAAIDSVGPFARSTCSSDAFNNNDLSSSTSCIFTISGKESKSVDINPGAELISHDVSQMHKDLELDEKVTANIDIGSSSKAGPYRSYA